VTLNFRYVKNYLLLVIIFTSGCAARIHMSNTINANDPDGYATLKVETVGDHGFFDYSKKRLCITHLD